MEYPYNQPCRQSPRGKGKVQVKPTQIKRAQWTPRAKRNYMEAYHTQIIARNTMNGQNTLCSEGWQYFLANLNAMMQGNYTMTMVKNEFQNLKREYAFVKQLIHGITGGGFGAHGNLNMDDEWWEAKDAVTGGKASKFRHINLIPYRDLGPEMFDEKCANGNYAVAPSVYSNTIYAGGEDANDSDPDHNEGSGDSGDAIQDKACQRLTFHNVTGSSGSSGKRKRLVMGHNSQLTSCRRRLEGYDFSAGSMQTMGKDAATSSAGIPTITQCMSLINKLEETDLPLHIYACKLIKDPANREMLAGFTTENARIAWIVSCREESSS